LRIRGVAEGNKLIDEIDTEAGLQHQGRSEDVRVGQTQRSLLAVGIAREAWQSLSERQRVHLIAVKPAARQRVLSVEYMIDAAGVLVQFRRHRRRCEEVKRALIIVWRWNELILDF